MRVSGVSIVRADALIRGGGVRGVDFDVEGLSLLLLTRAACRLESLRVRLVVTLLLLLLMLLVLGGVSYYCAARVMRMGSHYV